jgi:hypothetical protein
VIEAGAGTEACSPQPPVAKSAAIRDNGRRGGRQQGYAGTSATRDGRSRLHRHGRRAMAILVSSVDRVLSRVYEAAILAAATFRHGAARRRSTDGRALRGSFETFFDGAQWVGDGWSVPVAINGHRRSGAERARRRTAHLRRSSAALGKAHGTLVCPDEPCFPTARRQTSQQGHSSEQQPGMQMHVFTSHIWQKSRQPPQSTGRPQLSIVVPHIPNPRHGFCCTQH